MNSKSNLRIAILGGGIGGASTAVALRHAGFNVNIYEQAAAITEVGAGIGLRPPSIHYFKKWGLLEEIERVTHKSAQIEILSDQAEVVLKEQWPALTDDPNEKWARLIHRADCLDTLINAIPSEFLHLNHKCKNIVRHGNYAEIEFENGVKVEADLVIGADGIRSLTRTLFFSQAQPVFHHYHAYRALVNEEETYGLATEDTLRIIADDKVNIYLLPLKYRKQVSVDITVPHSDPTGRPNVPKEDMLRELKNYHPDLQKIAENVDHWDIRALYDIDPINQWSNECITLLGDSAHSMLHNQGQGANMAIQDAGVLAECLLEADSIAEALQKYETLRKPVCHLFQNLSRQFHSAKEETFFPEKEFFENA
ncbi:NAD(P)/FAD-dependent oxidoreductase [Neobacillus sp. YX16]|uniref:FAD-dependent oxidoreductase n=1 Tax=Neobacillus sp. YX16 TaxID=3047874 RepID=UPI0024C326E4|nr:NAD(P)/FAD-dependent oxidoreductase [Neobacillus sp. YX16]WHZ04296.1 NAD(P)/FAD-dependent oxidoreductase [Neobacillus sp. YX16]